MDGPGVTIQSTLTCWNYVRLSLPSNGGLNVFHQFDTKCLHLVDSLVVLHSLTRGRSSSRKMRRTLMRLNSYLLASGLVPLWAYVDTHQNPADRPSRRGVKKRWVKKV